MTVRLFFTILVGSLLFLILGWYSVSLNNLVKPTTWLDTVSSEELPPYFDEEKHRNACLSWEIICDLQEEEVKLGESAFFIVSAQVSNDKAVPINARQACGIESAAKYHPEKDIYVIIVTPSSITSLDSRDSLLATKLMDYPNIKFRIVHMRRFLENTPMHVLLKRLEKTYYPVEHTSDILRYTLLYKFGGLYLDTDVILLKQMPVYENYIGAEQVKYAGAGAFHFGMDRVGREMAADTAQQLIKLFNGNEYSTSGPIVVTQVLHKRCGIPADDNLLRTAREAQEGIVCDGFTITPPYVFYGVPFASYQLFFQKGSTQKVWKMLENSTTIHYWNHMTTKMAANEPTIPFYDTAQKHCPFIFYHAKQLF